MTAGLWEMGGGGSGGDGGATRALIQKQGNNQGRLLGGGVMSQRWS